jgi:hypothetical protein
MVRFAGWQWGVLGAPIGVLLLFILISAGYQIHAWHLSWIWAIVGVGLLGWRWLLVKWTTPAMSEVDDLLAEIAASLPDAPTVNDGSNHPLQQAETALQQILTEARGDLPIWADWNTFWRRCLELIGAIAKIYNPKAKQPLLNIYIPQAYVLLRGTVDDLNEWMQKMAPVLNQVTIEQALQAYEIYQKLQPAARRVWQAWNWARWLLNPAAAAATLATQGSRSKANQELLGNLNQIAREAVLRNLARQAIALYSGKLLDSELLAPTSPAVPNNTPTAQSIQDLLNEATPIAAIETQSLNLLLLGRTGAGKSSLVNALFGAPIATVDALPSTIRLQDYQWQTSDGASLTLWDSPGYEQVAQSDLRDLVIEQATQSDLILLASPAMDPALQIDVEMLQAIANATPETPKIGIMTQVDRLRPLKEWQPPYDWRSGSQAKAVNIREALAYRSSTLTDITTWLPVSNLGEGWGFDQLSMTLITMIAPAQQARLARFLRDRDARAQAAVGLIDRYTRQMATQQGITVFLKSPILRFIATLATGSPTLAILLAEKIPIEQLPLVIGKAQMAYELHNLITPTVSFDLLQLWPLLRDNRDRADRNAWAFGHTLLEHWLKDLPTDSLSIRLNDLLSTDH